MLADGWHETVFLSMGDSLDRLQRAIPRERQRSTTRERSRADCRRAAVTSVITQRTAYVMTGVTVRNTTTLVPPRAPRARRSTPG
eukprot:2804518-Prymnesium_polylepis.1